VGQLNDIVTSVQNDVKEITRKLESETKQKDSQGNANLEQALRTSQQEIAELKDSVRVQSKMIEELLGAWSAKEKKKKPKKGVRINSDEQIFEISVARISGESSDFIMLSKEAKE
jgi:TolA-binding protein